MINLAIALHPGHGVTPPASAAHWLCEPAHLGLLVLVASLALVAWTALRNLGVRS